MTDGRTDGRAIAYSALSVICCRALKTHKNVSTILQNCAIARISLHYIHLLLNRASPKLQKNADETISACKNEKIGDFEVDFLKNFLGA